MHQIHRQRRTQIKINVDWINKCKQQQQKIRDDGTYPVGRLSTYVMSILSLLPPSDASPACISTVIASATCLSFPVGVAQFSSSSFTIVIALPRRRHFLTHHPTTTAATATAVAAPITAATTTTRPIITATLWRLFICTTTTTTASSKICECDVVFTCYNNECVCACVCVRVCVCDLYTHKWQWPKKCVF